MTAVSIQALRVRFLPKVPEKPHPRLILVLVQLR